MGGHSHWKVVWGCAALKTPFFRPFCTSGDPPFQVLLQLQRDPTSIFWKILHFWPHNFHWFWLNFSSWDTNFSNNLPQRPKFQAKIQFLWPYFWIPEWHIPTQIFLSILPPPLIKAASSRLIWNQCQGWKVKHGVPTWWGGEQITRCTQLTLSVCFVLSCFCQNIPGAQ